MLWFSRPVTELPQQFRGFEQASWILEWKSLQVSAYTPSTLGKFNHLSHLVSPKVSKMINESILGSTWYHNSGPNKHSTAIRKNPNEICFWYSTYKPDNQPNTWYKLVLPTHKRHLQSKISTTQQQRNTRIYFRNLIIKRLHLHKSELKNIENVTRRQRTNRLVWKFTFTEFCGCGKDETFVLYWYKFQVDHGIEQNPTESGYWQNLFNALGCLHWMSWAFGVTPLLQVSEAPKTVNLIKIVQFHNISNHTCWWRHQKRAQPMTQRSQTWKPAPKRPPNRVDTGTWSGEVKKWPPVRARVE